MKILLLYALGAIVATVLIFYLDVRSRKATRVKIEKKLRKDILAGKLPLDTAERVLWLIYPDSDVTVYYDPESNYVSWKVTKI